jgi:hypothetical protein
MSNRVALTGDLIARVVRRLRSAAAGDVVLRAALVIARSVRTVVSMSWMSN